MRIEKQEQERQFAEALVSIIGNDKKVCMALALLDMIYLKSLILKHFTEEKQQTELPLHKQTIYHTYGGEIQMSFGG